MIRLQELQKMIKLTGARAMLDAKANGTCIVYIKSDGQMVKEYPNGEIVPMVPSETPHE